MFNFFTYRSDKAVISQIESLKNLSNQGKLPDYEEILTAGYCKLINNADVVMDIGAHTGRHLQKFMGIVGLSGFVHGIEPLPDQYEYLKTTFGNNNILKLHNIALSDFDGKTDFCIAEGCPEESGLKQRIYNNPSAVIPKIINVQVKSIDNYFIDLNRLDYLKIDAEGAEISILNGGKRLLKKLRPIISIEYGFPSYSVYGLTNISLYNWCVENKYLVADLYGNFILSRELFIQACDSIYWDYFLVPMEKKRYFKKRMAK